MRRELEYKLSLSLPDMDSTSLCTHDVQLSACEPIFAPVLATFAYIRSLSRQGAYALEIEDDRGITHERVDLAALIALN